VIRDFPVVDQTWANNRTGTRVAIVSACPDSGRVVFVQEGRTRTMGIRAFFAAHRSPEEQDVYINARFRELYDAVEGQR